MKSALIITEDIIKIQTLTGLLGRLFSFLYLSWLKTRLKLAVFLLQRFFKLSVITSDAFELHDSSVYYYGTELAKLDYAANRRQYLDLTDRLLKTFPQNLFFNRLAIHLTYDYFIYVPLYVKLFKKIKPDLVITLSSSYLEQIASYLAQEIKVKVLKPHFMTFIWLNHWLKRFFLRRQFQKKINQFKLAAQIPPPPIQNLRSAMLMSLDFFRHFKTLAPLYQALEKHHHNPWLVTDIINVKPVLKNLNQVSAHHFFLAGFLPKEFTLRPVSLPKKINSVKNQADFLYNLGLTAAAPMIELGQTLSRLYLAAGANLFKQIKPKAVIVVSDSRFCELSLAALAKTNQVQSLLVSPNTLLALDWLNSYDTTDKIALPGDFVKNQLIKIGVPEKKLTVVGDLQQQNKPKLTKKQIYRLLGVDKLDKKIALLISFGPSQMIPKPEKAAFFQLASRAVAAGKNTVLVIKPHPSEKRYRVLEELKEWGIANAIVTDNNQLELVELLNVCSVVLQTWSMTVFEAIMMNRPVISVNPFKKDYGFFLPIIKDGGAVTVTNRRGLTKWLTILTDPNQPQTKQELQQAKQACARYITVHGGQAVDKILNLLAKDH
ncbi:MAG: hypothetical protein AAB430_00980 [Patescibacteria group bacterium]